jgi:hypothetical protein
MPFVYMEECSIEAALQEYPGEDHAPGHLHEHDLAGLHQTHTGSGESGASSGVSGGSLTKVMPSGRLGRRRTSASESDMILVVDEDLEGFSSSHLAGQTQEEDEHKVYEQLNEHLHEQEQDLDDSERDTFRTVPAVAVFQPTLDRRTVARTYAWPLLVHGVARRSNYCTGTRGKR